MESNQPQPQAKKGGALKNMAVRAMTGVVYVGLLVGGTLYGPHTMFLFFALVCIATQWEFCNILNRHYGAMLNRPIICLAGFCLNAAVWLTLIGGNGGGQMFALFGFMMLYLLVSELYLRADDPLRNWTLSFASQVYIALPLSLMPMLSIFRDGGGVAYVWIYPIALFVFLWINDTGAYLCGSVLHRFFPLPLFPRISPHKSWVGSIGGGLLCLTSSLVFFHFLPAGLTLWQWLGFALVVVVFGTWGDLVESLLKRQLGIKDSGNILPGHGGMLDRFDSALLAIPAVVIYFIAIGA